MKKLYLILLTATVLIAASHDVYSADITWKLYLRQYMTQGPILESKSSTGRDFVIEDVELTGSQTQSGELIYDLEGATFSLSETPSNQALEIRIILNASEDEFSTAGTTTVFLNVSFEVYSAGRLQDQFRFPTGSPLVMCIPKGNGLDNMLDKCDFSRSDNIIFVYYEGGDFSDSGIETFNQISGFKAHLDYTSTVVGGLGDDFGFPQDFQFRPWFKIKELFK